jgi:hypothetical protein
MNEQNKNIQNFNFIIWPTGSLFSVYIAIIMFDQAC